MTDEIIPGFKNSEYGEKFFGSKREQKKYRVKTWNTKGANPNSKYSKRKNCDCGQCEIAYYADNSKNRRRNIRSYLHGICSGFN